VLDYRAVSLFNASSNLASSLCCPLIIKHPSKSTSQKSSPTPRKSPHPQPPHPINTPALAPPSPHRPSPHPRPTTKPTPAQADAAVAEQQHLAAEKAALADAVRRLTREVSRLEGLRRNLLRQLQDDDDGGVGSNSKVGGLAVWLVAAGWCCACETDCLS